MLTPDQRLRQRERMALDPEDKLAGMKFVQEKLRGAKHPLLDCDIWSKMTNEQRFPYLEDIAKKTKLQLHGNKLIIPTFVRRFANKDSMDPEKKHIRTFAVVPGNPELGIGPVLAGRELQFSGIVTLNLLTGNKHNVTMAMSFILKQVSKVHPEARLPTSKENAYFIDEDSPAASSGLDAMAVMNRYGIEIMRYQSGIPRIPNQLLRNEDGQNVIFSGVSSHLYYREVIPLNL